MQNKQISFQITNGSIEEAVAVSLKIPEFNHPHLEAVYKERMAGKKQLILLAVQNGEPIGFKVGYDKFEDGKNFYSWMGGVLPKYRKSGVANALAKKQETWAKDNDFEAVMFKTRNRHQAMLIFAIKNNFKIIEVEPREDIEEYRILLRKIL